MRSRLYASALRQGLFLPARQADSHSHTGCLALQYGLFGISASGRTGRKEAFVRQNYRLGAISNGRFKP